MRTDEVTGRHASPDGVITDAHGVWMYLLRDPKMDEGFRVVTAYPGAPHT
jgi:hypothetical protein